GRGRPPDSVPLRGETFAPAKRRNAALSNTSHPRQLRCFWSLRPFMLFSGCFWLLWRQELGRRLRIERPGTAVAQAWGRSESAVDSRHFDTIGWQERLTM